MIPGMGVISINVGWGRFTDSIASTLLTVWFSAHFILREGVVSAQT